MFEIFVHGFMSTQTIFCPSWSAYKKRCVWPEFLRIFTIFVVAIGEYESLGRLLRN